MNTKTLFLIVLVLLVLFQSGCYAYRFLPIDISELPRAKPDDRILVVMLQAPLFFNNFGPLMEYFNLYHTGVGFVNLNTKQNWTVEYDALPTFAESVIPRVMFDNTTRKYELKYNNIGGAILYLGINSTYWNYQVVVSTINGTVHNDYIERWLKTANESHPFYNLFNVYSSWNNTTPDERKLLKPGYTCADFMFQSFDALYKFGATFYSHLRLKRNYMNAYSREPPVAVDYNDPKHHDKIVEQYMLLEGKFKSLGITKFLLSILDLITGELYLRFDDGYYFVKNQKGVNYHYALCELPGQKFTLPARNKTPIRFN